MQTVHSSYAVTKKHLPRDTNGQIYKHPIIDEIYSRINHSTIWPKVDKKYCINICRDKSRRLRPTTVWDKIK